MKQDLACLRCGAQMQFLKTEKFQLGETSWILGDLPNLFAGAIEVEIYLCPQCGKLEFYHGMGAAEKTVQSGIAQRTCPKCGLLHDWDDPKCPQCKHAYYR